MKKIFSLLLLPVFSILILFGCGDDREIKDIQTAYSEMVSDFTVSGESDFFSDSEKPNSIVISYPATIKQAIENTSPSNSVQKRYRALYYQQEILNNIFTYYNNYQEEFYRETASKDIDEDKINSLYDSAKNLHETLTNFEGAYNSFNDAIEDGISDVMKFNMTSYSFHLNKVIDASFDFVYKFHNIYTEYCVDNYDSANADNLALYVDKAYLDISYIAYLENIKSFNYSVGGHGVCDLADVVGSSNKYNLLSLLDSRKSISDFVTANLGATTEEGVEVTERINLFAYNRGVYEQRVNNYLTTYRSVDIFKINQYRFGLNGNVDYNSYLTSQSSSDRAVILMLDNFVEDTFLSYVEKLNTIVE